MSNVVRVLFSPELLVSLTRGRFEVVANAIPRDARISGCAYDVDRRSVTLYVEHESFAPVAPGDMIPIAEPPVIREDPT